jgi:hypothetical protein
MSTTGYSGTPLLKKLGIKPEMKILLVDAPDNYFDLLGESKRNFAFQNNLLHIKVCVVNDLCSGLKLVVLVAKR